MSCVGNFLSANQIIMADEQTDSLLDAALDTSKDDDSYVLDDHSGEEGEVAEDPVSYSSKSF